MNYRRTHSSHISAFPRHCDYACAIEVGKRSIFNRLRRFVHRIFNR